MVNTESDAVLDILKTSGGGSVDVQTYPVGLGGLTRVNVQPRLNISYDTTPTPLGLVIGFISGAMIAGIAAFVVAMVVMVAVAVSHDGTTNSGVSNALITTCFYCWVVATLLGGVAAVLYNLTGGND